MRGEIVERKSPNDHFLQKSRLCTFQKKLLEQKKFYFLQYMMKFARDTTSSLKCQGKDLSRDFDYCVADSIVVLPITKQNIFPRMAIND